MEIKHIKHMEISSFYTGVPKIMMMAYTVPDIWQVTDVIVIFYFGLYFSLYPTPPPPPPPNSPKNKNIKKMMKIPGDITILPKIHDHMLYCS